MASDTLLSEEEILFLDILKETIHDRTLKYREDYFLHLKEILHLSSSHYIFPLVLDALYPLNKKALEPYRKTVTEQTVKQAGRTASFLLLYQKMDQAGLSPTVMKGIVCRDLYPEGELRPSVDEDLLIDPEDISLYHDFLLKEGFLPSKDGLSLEENTYLHKGSGLCLEVHTSLFPSNGESYGELNSLFDRSRTVLIRIHGLDIKTLDHTEHFLYLVCHAYKHLIYSGIGIRQLCDMTLFLEHYGKHISYEKIVSSCKQKHLFFFLKAVLRLCIDHLGLDTSISHLPLSLQDPDIDTLPLLKDILTGGIYGAEDIDRLHSANMTLDAISSVKQGKRKKGILKSLFPSYTYMSGKYPYLKKRPYLLPVSWTERILDYLKKGKDPGRTIVIGRKRIELLKYYHILEEKEN
ncbi:MAG: nucleotidyltransferase family protein [Erysipelotrichaceae bacterium]|nr:nucleotidyltransferase family protein [Erysipelotrichaceae bacterium]